MPSRGSPSKHRRKGSPYLPILYMLVVLGLMWPLASLLVHPVAREGGALRDGRAAAQGGGGGDQSFPLTRFKAARIGSPVSVTPSPVTPLPFEATPQPQANRAVADPWAPPHLPPRRPQAVLCVLSAQRNVSYLPQVLASLGRELSSERAVASATNDTAPYYFWKVVVVDVDSLISDIGNHEAMFVRPTKDLDDCWAKGVDDDNLEELQIDNATYRATSCRVRQQTRDVATALEACQKYTRKWVVLVEDDTEACPGSLGVMREKLDVVSNFYILKFSKIFSGTAFHTRNVKRFTKFALQGVHYMPIDWSIQMPWDRRSHTVQGHDFNLFSHLGTISTFAERNREEYLNQHQKIRSTACNQHV